MSLREILFAVGYAEGFSYRIDYHVCGRCSGIRSEILCAVGKTFPYDKDAGVFLVDGQLDVRVALSVLQLYVEFRSVQLYQPVFKRKRLDFR